jgi:radical SAM superfamily enzyme YgiQ (UPF0313 family)
VPAYTIGLKHIMVCEPLELEYVAAGLSGHEVHILDLQVERGLRRKLRSFRPDVVGTSSYITGVNEVKKLCRTVKRWNPDVWTVVGGVHASRVAEDFVDDSVDVIVPGDGTSVMPELLAAIEEGRSVETVPGLALPSEGGSINWTDQRPYMPDPNELPFPRRDLTAHLRHKYYYIYHRPLALMKTTWGCWYDCSFCYTWRITGGRPYARSPESIVQELAEIEEDEVYIVDDIFLTNRKRLSELGRLIRERGIRKRYICFGRSDFIAHNEDLIEMWADLGLSAVLVGLEATTDAELELMNKRNTTDANVRAIEVLRKHGVDTYGSLIPDPGYGAEEWNRLWRFIDDNDLYYLNISPLTPLPGTEIWERYRDEITVPRQAHPLWDLSHVVLPTGTGLAVYYRTLLRTYSRAILDMRRARRVSVRKLPPLVSMATARVLWGAIKIWVQLRWAHRHHGSRILRKAMDVGTPVPRRRRDPAGQEVAM